MEFTVACVILCADVHGFKAQTLTIIRTRGEDSLPDPNSADQGVLLRKTRTADGVDPEGDALFELSGFAD